MEQELFRENLDQNNESERAAFVDRNLGNSNRTIEQSSNEDRISYLRSIIPLIEAPSRVGSERPSIDWVGETRQVMLSDATNSLGEKFTSKYIN